MLHVTYSMRIGIDCHHIEDQRGIKRYVLSLLKEWENLGYLRDRENKVICYFKEELPEFGELPKEVEIVVAPSRSNLFFQQVRLPYEAFRDRLQVLFSPSYILPLAYTRKTVLAIHDISYTTLPQEFDWPSRSDKWYLPFASRLSAKRATFVFTPSEFTKHEIVRSWNINPSKIFVTPLAGEINFGKTQPLLSRQNFILAIGTIFNRRNIPHLITAFYKLSRKHPTLRLILVGKDKTNPPQKINELIEDVNYKLGREALTRKDWLSDEDLLRLYYSARTLVSLSSYEGFGLPVLEAMSCGIPVLITKHGSLPEIAGDGALYINDPQDINEISEKLYKIISDSSLRKKLKEKGVKQAQRFNWAKTARQTWELLELATRT